MTTASLAEDVSLRPFSDPASVAVVGASDDPSKWGYWLATGAVAGQHRRSVFLVNHSAETVLGGRSYRSLADLPRTPELVVVVVPADRVASVVDEGLSRGVRAFVIITATVPDVEALRARVEAAGARMIGPNTLGLVDTTTDLTLAWGRFVPGPLAIVSQSGQVGSEIANVAARSGLGVSRFVSVGNQVDVTAADLVDDLASHAGTQVVVLYLESFADGPRIVSAMRRLIGSGRAVIVLTTGGSDGSRRLAQSHTGSMTSAVDAVDAACRAAGAVRVATPSEAVDLALVLRAATPVLGRRVAVVSDSGGQGGIAADVAASAGLVVPIFSDGLQAAISETLGPAAASSNPVDLAGAGEADLDAYSVACRRIASSGEADVIVLSGYFGSYAEHTPSLLAAESAVVDRISAAVEESGVPVVIHSMSAGSAVIDRMRHRGVPVFVTIESAMTAIGHAASLADEPGREPVGVSGTALSPRAGYWGAREALSERGVVFPVGRLVSTRMDLSELRGQLQFPVVLKAGWLAHKSEVGGVRLGLGSPDEVLAAYDEMHARLGPGEYVVEEQDQRLHGVEMLVGVRRDPDFGPLVTVGAGGTEAELHRDVTTELAPVDHATALRMIQRLRCLPLLRGWRGRPGTDVDALAALVASVSHVLGPDSDVGDVEINPVRVTPEGAVAFDALVIVSHDASSPAASTSSAGH